MGLGSDGWFGGLSTYNSSRSSKVIDLGANRKQHICNFLLKVTLDVCRDAQTLFSGLVQRDMCSRRGDCDDGGALRADVEGSVLDVRLPGRMLGGRAAPRRPQVLR